MNKRKEWARKIRERDNNTCVICGEPGENAHHIFCEGYFPELQYSESNGITLCRQCHVIAHRGKFGAKSKGKYPVDIAINKLLCRAYSTDVFPIIEKIVHADIINATAASNSANQSNIQEYKGE